MVLLIMSYKVVLTSDQIKATKQYFPVVRLVIMMYKVVLTFESVDEILWCDHSNAGKLLSSTFLWYC